MIQMPEEQAKEMRRRASEEGISVAEFARQGIALRMGKRRRDDEVRKRALSVIGALSSETGDVSERHNEIFAEAGLERAS